MNTALLVVAIVSLASWVELLLYRGGFWKADQRIHPDLPEWPEWPDVVAVIPARNEEKTVGATVVSLLAQDYPGELTIVVVDDGSTDGTVKAARAAEVSGRLTVVEGRPLEAGWTGKMWAVHQGLEHLDRSGSAAPYVLLTDADIEHHPRLVGRLVAKAEVGGFHLVSLMVRLRCRGSWERLLIPAFVFFFQKLYPFPWVNDPARPQAAAAGGCMLVRRRTLAEAGGVAAIRDRIIDDCALAALIKHRGPVWLGLAEQTKSLRAYPRLADIWAMVARSAYAQLKHSPLLLLAAVLGMAVLYLGPPGTVLTGAVLGDGVATVAGAAGWALMAIAYRPTLKLYGLAPWRGVLLPVAAFLYMTMTVDSALRHWRGWGGAWKGRSDGGG